MQLKNTFLILFVLFTLSGCAQHKKVTKKKQPKKTAKVDTKKPTNIHDSDSAKNDTLSAIAKDKADSIVAYAEKYLGVRYRYGGMDPKGFDCAGYVCFVFNHQGIKLPRTADAQALLGVEVSRKNARPGDLVYFKGRDVHNKAIGHVGIVIENNNGQIKFISATVSAGIHIDDIDGTYWKERYVFTKRILTQKKK